MKRAIYKIPPVVYAIPQLPADWVVRYGGKLFIVPARSNGCNSRKPYKGYDPDKIPTAQINYHPIGLGLPNPT